MNINDVAAPTTVPEDFTGMLRAIFFKQAELMVQYKEIEQLPSAPVSLHTASGQRIIKDFAWRTIEELTESYEAWEKHGEDWSVAQDHAIEELADSVHFFVELMIFAGITPDQCLERMPCVPSVVHKSVMLQTRYWAFTYRLGVAMNFLRNKAWKKSQVPTDELRFRDALLIAFCEMINLWAAVSKDESDIYTYYMRKSDVNKFRQRSNY